MINRSTFYNAIRASLFGGKLSEKQVEGIDSILDEWGNRGLEDKRWLAYILATAFHETAATMQPIKEYGFGKGKKYGIPDPATRQIYAGRGYVQLTWKWNYESMSKLLHVDLVNNPDLALQKDIAAKIMFEGMTLGSFTGKKLSNYFNETHEDYYNARRIINGIDKAALIAAHAKNFLKALS